MSVAFGKYMDEKVEQNYYSNTKSGRTAFYRYVERLPACLQEVTDQAHEGLILRANISACCQEIRGYMNYWSMAVCTCLLPRSNQFLILIQVEGNG